MRYLLLDTRRPRRFIGLVLRARFLNAFLNIRLKTYILVFYCVTSDFFYMWRIRIRLSERCVGEIGRYCVVKRFCRLLCQNVYYTAITYIFCTIKKDSLHSRSDLVRRVVCNRVTLLIRSRTVRFHDTVHNRESNNLIP